MSFNENYTWQWLHFLQKRNDYLDINGTPNVAQIIACDILQRHLDSLTSLKYIIP